MAKKTRPPPTYAVTPAGAEILRRALTASKDWTYKTLAPKVKTSVGTLHAVLSGHQRTFEFLPDLCKILRVSLYETQPLDELQIDALRALDIIRQADPAKARDTVESVKERAESVARKAERKRAAATPERPHNGREAR